jgi:hypothetical protein
LQTDRQTDKQTNNGCLPLSTTIYRETRDATQKLTELATPTFLQALPFTWKPRIITNNDYFKLNAFIYINNGYRETDRDYFPVFASFYRENATSYRKTSAVSLETIQSAERITDRHDSATDGMNTNYNIEQSSLFTRTYITKI